MRHPKLIFPLIGWVLLAAACSGAPPTPPTPLEDASMPGMEMGPTSNPTARPSAPGVAEDRLATPMPSVMPGMQMEQPGAVPENVGMSGTVMQDEPVDSEGVLPATETEGGQILPFVLDGQVKVFELTAQPVLWNINAETQVTAWTYNGTVPGPLVRVTEGDRVRVVFTNNLPSPTSIHWHGLPVPSNMDGVSQPELSQPPVRPGQTFVYEFEARPAGTFMYHSHYDTDTQINIGLFGGFIIEPRDWEDRPDQDITLILNE